MKRTDRAAFTLAELLVSLAASVFVIGGLLSAVISLQRTLVRNERNVAVREDQRRVLDYLAREMRRATMIATKDGSGLPIGVNGQTIHLSNDTPLIFTLPGYYRSNDPATREFDQPAEVLTNASAITYGDASGPAPQVIVWLSKAYVAEEGCTCFVRKEGAFTRVIARHADSLHVHVHFSADGRVCDIASSARGLAEDHVSVLASFDQVLLRNPDREWE